MAIAELQLPRARYADGKLTAAFYERLLERLRGEPGIDGASAITNFLLGRLPDSGTFYIEGRKDQITTPLTTDTVTPEFFSTMKIPLLRGPLLRLARSRRFAPGHPGQRDHRPAILAQSGPAGQAPDFRESRWHRGRLVHHRGGGRPIPSAPAWTSQSSPNRTVRWRRGPAGECRS